MGTDAQQGLLLNIVVGIVGALLAGWLFDRGNFLSGDFNLVSLLFALLGAIILLFIVGLFRGRTRGV